jgi:hypothetical protein
MNFNEKKGNLEFARLQLSLRKSTKSGTIDVDQLGLNWDTRLHMAVLQVIEEWIKIWNLGLKVTQKCIVYVFFLFFLFLIFVEGNYCLLCISVTIGETGVKRDGFRLPPISPQLII